MKHLLLVALLTPAAFAAEPGKVDKPADKPAPQNAPAEPADLKPIFNGKDLTGWYGDPRFWSAADGVIRGKTTPENPCKSNTFLVYKGENARDEPATVGDFELRFSFKIQGGNSGVQYRSRLLPAKETDANKWVASGYQAEIAGQPGKDGFLYHEKGPGRGYSEKKNYLAWVGDKVEIGPDGVSKVTGSLGKNGAIAAANRKGDWNDYIIIARGNLLAHYINGVQTIECTDNDAKNAAKSGVLALQIHAGGPMTIEFKNLRMKALP